MVQINRRVFIGVLLMLVIIASSSVSYLTARGVGANYSFKGNIGNEFSEFEVKTNIIDQVFITQLDFKEGPAITTEYSPKDILLIERVVTAEATGEPLQGKIAVVNVIMNRVNSQWYPNSIKEVIYQEGQFNPTWDGSLEKVKEIDLSVKRAVQHALKGYQAVPEKTLFFLNEDIAKDFTIPNTRQFEKKIGNHSFYR